MNGLKPLISLVHGSELAMWVGLRLLTHSSHAVAAGAVRHCETVGTHTQPATHSGTPGALLLPLGQHLARGSGQGLGTLHGQHSPLSTHLSLSQEGCWLQSSRHEGGSFRSLRTSEGIQSHIPFA